LILQNNYSFYFDYLYSIYVQFIHKSYKIYIWSYKMWSYYANVIHSLYIPLVNMDNIDYNQHGQISQHGLRKYRSLDLLKVVQGFCHPPTTLHMARCYHIKGLSCPTVWIYKNTKLILFLFFQNLFKWKYEYEWLNFET
jgi:hypothetical protein